MSKTQSLETSKRRYNGSSVHHNIDLSHDTSQLNSIDTRLNSPPRDTGGYVSSLWTFEISRPAGLATPTIFILISYLGLNLCVFNA